MKYCLLLWLIIGLTSPAQAEPAVKTQYKYYWIYPKNKQDLGKALDKQSPIIFRGNKYRGFTQWQVNWDYRWWKTASRCKLTTVNVTLNIVYTLPQIPENHRVDPDTHQAFNRYFQALFKHEQNHQRSGLLAAQEIETTLLNLPDFPDCTQLETAANKQGNALIQKYRQRDVNYDRQTDYGRTEGVILTD